MRTLWGIMRELEHTDRIIDVVKIDREGPRKAYEPAVIRNLLEDGTYRYLQLNGPCQFWNNKLSCIRQLVFELHFFGPMTDPDEIRSLFSMLKGKQGSTDGQTWARTEIISRYFQGWKMLVWNCFDLSNQRRKQNWNPSMIFWRFKMKKAHSCTFYHGSIPIRPFAIENFNWKFLFFCAIYYIYAAKTNLNKPMSYWLYKLLVLFSFLTASYWNKTRLKSLFFN